MRLLVLACAFLCLSAVVTQPSEAGQRGTASWYGNAAAATVAHRTLPLGTVVGVRNLRNGRTAHATVTTRGPYAKGRTLDLSRGMARRLDMEKQGTAPVEVTVVRRPQHNVRYRQAVLVSRDHLRRHGRRRG
jgi:rare lipoprotein A